MIGVLIRNEWKAILRDGRGVVVLLLGALLAVVSTWSAAETDHQERSSRAAAAASARAAWLERPADNPHSRAHFGDYVYRPSGPLAGLDPGLQAVTGRAVFAEAHRQNAAFHKPQEEAATVLRFGRLEPSTVLQLLVPLLLVLVGFGTVATERESARLRLLWIQGVRPMQLLLAKSVALWSLGAALTVLVVGVHVVFAGGAEPARLAAYAALHLGLLMIVAVLVTCVSARVRRSGTAAAVLMCGWVCAGVVLPRLAATTAAALDPLPSRDAFEAAMRADREQGLDGHDPRDTRRQALEQQILDQYGVQTKEELPLNLSGLLFQADEEYGAMVWDEHFGRLEGQLLRQSVLAGAWSLLNPIQAADRLSMAIAGTDLVSHVSFLRQVESYRRQLVESLNHEHAFGGSRTGERGWTATPEFYASFDSFRYRPPVLGELLPVRSLELLALALWGTGVGVLLFASARRLEQGGAL